VSELDFIIKRLFSFDITKLYLDISHKWQTSNRGAKRHYPLMTLPEIKSIPVSELADPNGCHLWLWTTNASLKQAYEVLEEWGFEAKGILTWVKPGIGLGQYLRNATEHLLLGTRGKAPTQFRGQPSWTFAPKQSHSTKPEEQYAIIERMSPGPRLELFARRPRHGWDVWGNEIKSDIAIAGYPVPGCKKGGA